MDAPLVRHGWQIVFQPQLFAQQYAELKAEVKRLKQALPSEDFLRHPRVKLLAAVMAAIKEHIAADPYSSRFALKGPLRHYGRLKGLGLPDRYRLFFRPFEAGEVRILLILWLGFPRKEGDRNDCYAAFSRLVSRGEFPDNWQDLQRECKGGVSTCQALTPSLILGAFGGLDREPADTACAASGLVGVLQAHPLPLFLIEALSQALDYKYLLLLDGPTADSRGFKPSVHAGCGGCP